MVVSICLLHSFECVFLSTGAFATFWFTVPYSSDVSSLKGPALYGCIHSSFTLVWACLFIDGLLCYVLIYRSHNSSDCSQVLAQIIAQIIVEKHTHSSWRKFTKVSEEGPFGRYITSLSLSLLRIIPLANYSPNLGNNPFRNYFPE
jgi:hypothetical protein